MFSRKLSAKALSFEYEENVMRWHSIVALSNALNARIGQGFAAQTVFSGDGETLLVTTHADNATLSGYRSRALHVFR